MARLGAPCLGKPSYAGKYALRYLAKGRGPGNEHHRVLTDVWRLRGAAGGAWPGLPDDTLLPDKPGDAEGEAGEPAPDPSGISRTFAVSKSRF